MACGRADVRPIDDETFERSMHEIDVQRVHGLISFSSPFLLLLCSTSVYDTRILSSIDFLNFIIFRSSVECYLY